MELYQLPPSPPCQVVLALIHERGYDDIALKPVDIAGGQLKTPEFLALNPLGQIPTLKDGDFGLGEALAI